jgi:hypothetical protein
MKKLKELNLNGFNYLKLVTYLTHSKWKHILNFISKFSIFIHVYHLSHTKKAKTKDESKMFFLYKTEKTEKDIYFLIQL